METTVKTTFDEPEDIVTELRQVAEIAPVQIVSSWYYKDLLERAALEIEKLRTVLGITPN